MMAEANISVDQDKFICPVCLDLLKDPVTVPCGHSFCKACINCHWDQEDQKRVYSCPQCRETFTPRPVLRRNNMLAEVVEKLKKTEELQTGAADVECDFCTGIKHKAIKSCLKCLASYCETHIKPHYQSPVFKKHKLVDATSNLQEKICSQHDEVLKIYCRTDQHYICYECTMDEHKGHDTVAVKAERAKKQSELKEVQRKLQQRLQEKLKKVEEVKQTVNMVKRSAQTAVEDSEKIFTELICSIEKKRSEVRKLIRDQEKDEVSRAEGVLEQLEQEIADLKRRGAELEQLSHTEDHIHFLQNFQSLCVSSGSEDSSSISVHQHPSFDGVRKSLSELKERLEKFCREEFNKIPPHAAAGQINLPSEAKSRKDFLQTAVGQKILPSDPKSRKDFLQTAVGQTILPSYPKSRKDFLQTAVGQTILPSDPKSRKDFLQYFCHLTLDPNTAHQYLILSEMNRVVRRSETEQRYCDHPERFNYWSQVLCKESVCGRCYWEVEWSKKGCGVSISVSYKEISRKGRGDECGFGYNNQSWSLDCSSRPHFYHNNIKTELSESPSFRIGVYVDHSAGTLSFYRVSDTMTLLHRVHTTFTQPLYAGFGVDPGTTVRLCDPK